MALRLVTAATMEYEDTAGRARTGRHGETVSLSAEAETTLEGLGAIAAGGTTLAQLSAAEATKATELQEYVSRKKRPSWLPKHAA
jgi:hypothetical protein